MVCYFQGHSLLISAWGMGSGSGLQYIHVGGGGQLTDWVTQWTWLVRLRKDIKAVYLLGVNRDHVMSLPFKGTFDDIRSWLLGPNIFFLLLPTWGMHRRDCLLSECSFSYPCCPCFQSTRGLQGDPKIYSWLVIFLKLALYGCSL